MKLLMKLSFLVVVAFSLNACMGHKHMPKEDANFMLMKKQNKNSHYKWMSDKK